MPRLIVDDAGQKKAFRVSQGRLSIGSADSAKLRLTADGVEAEHAVLVVRPEGAQVQVTQPVTIGGEAVESGEVDLPFGAPLAVGGATITVEADQAESKPIPAKPAAKAKSAVAKGAGAKAGAAKAGGAKAGGAKRPAARSGSARGGAGKGAARAGKGAEGAEPSERRRAGSRGQEKKGLPAWVPFVGVAAGLAIAIWLFSGLGSSSSAKNAMTAASNSMEQGNLKTARRELDTIKPDKLDAELKQRYDTLIAELEGRESFKSGADNRMQAIRQFDEQVRRLVDNQFKSDPPEPAKVRLLWDRMADWRATWPMHNDPVWLEDANWGELKSWMEEHEAKYASVVSKTAPYTLADAEFRAYYFLDSDKKRYNLVLPVLDAAISNITDEMELELANGLRSRLVDEQRVYAQGRFDQSRAKFEEGDDVQAAAGLITDVRTLTEPDLIERAAALLINFPRIRPIMEGYKRNQPDVFAEVMQITTIGSFVRANMPDILEDSPQG